MNVTARYFAFVRERAGRSSEGFQIESGGTVTDLWELVVAVHPDLREFGAAIRFAVNGSYAQGDTVLREGDEVAILPPMSGGCQ